LSHQFCNTLRSEMWGWNKSFFFTFRQCKNNFIDFSSLDPLQVYLEGCVLSENCIKWFELSCHEMAGNVQAAKSTGNWPFNRLTIFFGPNTSKSRKLISEVSAKGSRYKPFRRFILLSAGIKYKIIFAVNISWHYSYTFISTSPRKIKDFGKTWSYFNFLRRYNEAALVNKRRILTSK